MQILVESLGHLLGEGAAPTLRRLGEDPDLPHLCLPIAGLQYYDYDQTDDMIGQLRPKSGDRIQMVRQPDNPHDRNAVELRWHNGQFQLGHLPRRAAGRIAPLIDAGQAIRAYALNSGTGQAWSVNVVLVSACLATAVHP